MSLLHGLLHIVYRQGWNLDLSEAGATVKKHVKTKARCTGDTKSRRMNSLSQGQRGHGTLLHPHQTRSSARLANENIVSQQCHSAILFCRNYFGSRTNSQMKIRFALVNPQDACEYERFV